MNWRDESDFHELEMTAEVVAPRLLGCLLERELDGVRSLVRIVETEAYSQEDAASHSYRGKTPRTDVMFGPAGRLYVYFTYGMHYCANIVCGQEGVGSGVLIRAVEPIDGINALRANRQNRSDNELTNGPAKLCQALSIDRRWNGHDLRQKPLRLLMQDPVDAENLVQTTRIGISQAKDVPWRFYIRDNAYVSVPIS